MNQIKVVLEWGKENFETSMNRWLRENADLKVTEIKYAVLDAGEGENKRDIHSAMIVHEVGE